MRRTTKNETGLRRDRSGDTWDRSIARILPRENNAPRCGLQKGEGRRCRSRRYREDGTSKSSSRRLWLLWQTADCRMCSGVRLLPPWTIVDEAWVISLNANGVVINTAHFVSP